MADFGEKVTDVKIEQITDKFGRVFWYIPEGHTAIAIDNDGNKIIGKVVAVSFTKESDSWGCTMLDSEGNEIFPYDRFNIRPFTKLEKVLK